jgi:hypothetical protein
MMILVSGATATFRRFAHHGCFGVLKTPNGGNDPRVIASLGLPWACDNGCGPTKSGRSAWSPCRFRAMVRDVVAVDRSRLLWVAIPDVLGDWRATRGRFDEWQPHVASFGLPVAYVAQDGCEDTDTPWRRFVALFVGGSTDWKMSSSVVSLVAEARARGKFVHFGRVNSRKRLRHAREIGCDTIDGTSISTWPDVFFPRMLRWSREAERDFPREGSIGSRVHAGHQGIVPGGPSPRRLSLPRLRRPDDPGGVDP